MFDRFTEVSLHYLFLSCRSYFTLYKSGLRKETSGDSLVIPELMALSSYLSCLGSHERWSSSTGESTFSLNSLAADSNCRIFLKTSKVSSAIWLILTSWYPARDV